MKIVHIIWVLFVLVFGPSSLAEVSTHNRLGIGLISWVRFTKITEDYKLRRRVSRVVDSFFLLHESRVVALFL